MEASNITFQDLGLSEAMLKALEKKGYGYPTTIQAQAIPHFMQWKDVIAKAPTGTGKTFAFGIPMIEHIDPECADVQGLILAPTRELAIQIHKDAEALSIFTGHLVLAWVFPSAFRSSGSSSTFRCSTTLCPDTSYRLDFPSSFRRYIPRSHLTRVELHRVPWHPRLFYPLP